eukprot:356361-Pleurochrysis_carterae.AAC.1
MDPEDVATAPFPGDLRAPQPTPRPGRKASGGRRRNRLPRTTSGSDPGGADDGADEASDERDGGRPQGPTAISGPLRAGRVRRAGAGVVRHRGRGGGRAARARGRRGHRGPTRAH